MHAAQHFSQHSHNGNPINRLRTDIYKCSWARATSSARQQQTACEMHDTSAMIVIIVFTIVTFACMHLHLHACKSKLNAPTSCMHVHVLVCIHLDAI